MWANEDYLNDKRIHDDDINHTYFLDENEDMIPEDIFIKKKPRQNGGKNTFS